MRFNFLAVTVLSSILIIGSVPHSVFGLDNETCDSETQEFKNTQKALMSSSEDSVRAKKALSWIKGQMQPSVANSGDGESIISVKEDLNIESVGTASGTFSLKNGYEKIYDSSIIVQSPNPIADDFRGIVSGKLNVPVETGYTVKTYKVTDAEYPQSYAPVAAVNPVTGEWQVDLSAVPVANKGYWAFKLFDSGGNQIGKTWNKNTKSIYESLEIRSYVLTDQLYFKGSQPASGDDTWGPLNVSRGAKIFRIVDTNTDQIIAEKIASESTGLVRGYKLQPGDKGYGTSLEQVSFVYAQSTTILLAIGLDERDLADQALKGMLLTQSTSGDYVGAFPTRTNQFSPRSVGDYHVGNNSFAAYALIRYYEKYGDQNGVLDALNLSLEFLKAQKVDSGEKSGLYTGGYVSSGGVYSKLNWVSTEHNTDLWHVFERSSRVLASDDLKNRADDLEKAILEKLWNYDEDRFSRGYKDTFESLDSNAWGSIFLSAVGENKKAASAVKYTDNFYEDRGATKGYMHYIKPDAVRTVWFEGTYGVVHAKNIAGIPLAETVMKDTYSSQRADGSWQYQLDPDDIYQMTNASSTSSTNWFILSGIVPEMIWSECKTDKLTVLIPEAPNTGYEFDGVKR